MDFSKIKKDNWRPSDELDGVKLGTPEEERNRAKAWMDTAAQESRNTDYYREILDQIALTLGPEAYTDDTGVVHDSPMRAKMAELVKARLKANATSDVVTTNVSYEVVSTLHGFCKIIMGEYDSSSRAFGFAVCVKEFLEIRYPQLRKYKLNGLLNGKCKVFVDGKCVGEVDPPKLVK